MHSLSKAHTGRPENLDSLHSQAVSEYYAQTKVKD